MRLCHSLNIEMRHLEVDVKLNTSIYHKSCMRQKRADAKTSQLRRIPSVTEVFSQIDQSGWSAGYARGQVIQAIREELDQLRAGIRGNKSTVPALDELTVRIRKRVEDAHSASLIRVINATGIIVHTNLGRAPLSEEAISHMTAISGSYSNLEFDLAKGKRGSREEHIEKHLSSLLQTEASLIVNNNAAALLLIVNTLSEGKEVLVSRGELVEIGGSFRLPEIMRKSGAILKEVGTTNKTRIEDYSNAINDNTGMILIVHPSNYQIIGFTEKPSLQALLALGREFELPVVEDHGSGILLDLGSFGIPSEPTVQQRLQEGLEVICFSGDKILGGPQAGIVCGKRMYIKRMRENPLFRVLRVSKLVYAAMEGTLLLYRKQEYSRIPVLAMLSQSAETLKSRAEQWLDVLGKQIRSGVFQVEPTTTYVGGGVAPMKGLPSYAVSVTHPDFTAEEIASRLRENDPPIVARVEEDRVYFEMRTIRPDEQNLITMALRDILSPPG
jgi:L-seryl-tRNA(Ser) seleniumtransferase